MRTDPALIPRRKVASRAATVYSGATGNNYKTNMNFKIAALLLIPVLAACTPVPKPIKVWKGATESALEQHWTHYNSTTQSGNSKFVRYVAYFERVPNGLPKPYTLPLQDGRRAFHKPPKELDNKDWITCEIVFEITNGVVSGATATGLACPYIQNTSGRTG